jgi:hypothetical protein
MHGGGDRPAALTLFDVGCYSPIKADDQCLDPEIELTNSSPLPDFCRSFTPIGRDYPFYAKS